MLGRDLEITWYGHASWLVGASGGPRILIDPWLSNPRAPGGDPPSADVLFVTHGHGDHTGDVVELAARLGCPVLASVELAGALESVGVQNTVGFNLGGTVEAAGARFTLTRAGHTGSITVGDRSLGYCEPTGVVIGFANGARVYAAGDTNAFSDMALIGEIHRPDVAILPIGDHYTMGPREAAYACRMLGIKHVVPGHWGTFPLLTGTPDALRSELAGLGLADVEVHALEPGETLR
jgi:L-ascorbate metabolism protein UlaG (beta-lactamase superfamily)